MVDDTSVPDYSGEEEVPKEDAILTLGRLAAKMGLLELEIEELERQLKEKQAEHKQYAENLVPATMTEIGLTSVKTRGGLHVEVKEQLHASFPTSNEEKRQRAFAYLKTTGNDGLIKRDFTISYGKSSTKWAEEFAEKLKELEVEKHAQISQEETIHPQTLLAFLRREIESAKEDMRVVPLEDFGAFLKTVAKIKRGK